MPCRLLCRLDTIPHVQELPPKLSLMCILDKMHTMSIRLHFIQRLMHNNMPINKVLQPTQHYMLQLQIILSQLYL